MWNKSWNKITSTKEFENSRLFFKSQIAVWLLILSGLSNAINFAIIWIWIEPVDYPIILHYNVYFGVDMIGDYRQAYFLPLTGFVLLAINLFLAIYFYVRKERIASYILLMATLMVQLSLIVGSLSIILINY